jgi:ABC-type phosphate/phosphonate transport system substrate-binding protein
MEAPVPIRVGAVIYDPKVTVIWDIIRHFFEEQDVPLALTFYADYDLQVDALLDDRIDIAWNSPLAWLDAQLRSAGRCRAIAMRDTDRDRVTHIVGRAGGAPGLAAVRGVTLGMGASDSPQATLIPLEWLKGQGLLEGRDFTARRFDVGVGLHGDHVGGELDAFRALERGEVAATVMLDLNFDAWAKDGTLDASRFIVLGTTERFDHCNFTVREEFPREREAEFLRALFAMRYDDPSHREMMDLEGLKEWLPGRTSGYEALEHAIVSSGFFAR